MKIRKRHHFLPWTQSDSFTVCSDHLSCLLETLPKSFNIDLHILVMSISPAFPSNLLIHTAQFSQCAKHHSIFRPGPAAYHALQRLFDSCSFFRAQLKWHFLREAFPGLTEEVRTSSYLPLPHHSCMAPATGFQSAFDCVVTLFTSVSTRWLEAKNHTALSILVSSRVSATRLGNS